MRSERLVEKLMEKDKSNFKFKFSDDNKNNVTKEEWTRWKKGDERRFLMGLFQGAFRKEEYTVEVDEDCWDFRVTVTHILIQVQRTVSLDIFDISVTNQRSSLGIDIIYLYNTLERDVREYYENNKRMIG